MKLMIRLVTVVLAVLILLYGLMMTASESGEVVVLTTTESDGSAHETRLWTVTHDGAQWLRSGSPSSGWYARLLANPDVTVRLGTREFPATAVPNPAATTTINALMNEKYGWADDTIDMMFGRDDAMAIRLVEHEAPAP